MASAASSNLDTNDSMLVTIAARGLSSRSPGGGARRQRAKAPVYVASQAGVHRFDGSSWTLIQTRRGAASLAEARDGTLWMVDGDGALWTLTREDSWKRRTEVTAKVVGIAAAPDGAVWA